MITKKITQLTALFLFIICSSTSAKEQSPPRHIKKQNTNSTKLWYKDFFFNDPSFNFEFVRMLGTTHSEGADVGECLTAASKIKNKDFDSWHNAWKELADRIYKFAEDSNKKGNIVSARNAYFRATSYYQDAGFYYHYPEKLKIAIDCWLKGRNSFLKAIASLPNIQTIKIPYENTTLPGYFIKAKNAESKAPLLIVNTGYDGTKEGLYYCVGTAAAERGYHCLLFEGPGQGEVIALQNLPFRYDWEKVITPAVDFAVKLPYVDASRIALMGRSMGGYLAPRAVAFEKRIKACIANGGVYSMTENIYKSLTPEVVKLIKSNSAEFNSIIEKYCKYSLTLKWFIDNGLWTFHVKTPADLFNQLNKYNMKNIAEKIECSMLIIDSEDDMFLAGQPQKLYNALKCPKTFLKFTKAESAELHCQEGAIAISNEKIFSWLNETFNYYPHKK